MVHSPLGTPPNCCSAIRYDINESGLGGRLVNNITAFNFV